MIGVLLAVGLGEFVLPKEFDWTVYKDCGWKV